MGGLHFDVTGDNSNFLRKLEETKHGVSEAAKFMESQGRKMDSTLYSFSFGDTLKKQIYEGSQSVNGLTAQIIKQKAVIKDVEQDVRNLGEAYRRAGAGTPKGNALFADFKSAKGALQEEKAVLFDLQTQQAQARLSVRKLKDEYSFYQKEGQNVVAANNNMALSFQKTLAAIGGVAALKQLGSAIIEARAEMQQLEKSFEVLLGSKAKSDVFVKEIKDYALISPLSTSDVSKAAQTLLGFGVASEKVIPTLKMLGDVSMGNSQRFSSLALAFAQVQAAGKLTGNDLLQLVNAGFNPLKNISEKTGKSMSDLKKEMSDGSISADMVADAFKSATEQGGQFHGMIEKNADGIRNAQNVLQGAIQETLNKIGEQNEGLIKGGYKAATYLVENYREIGNCVTGLIGVYGTYRTALLINSVLELGSVKAVWAKITATKAATIAQATYNKVLMMNPYVMVGAALVSLGIAMWTFADNTSTAERAQKRFNERQDEAQKLEQEHKQKIDSLVESSRDSALSDLQRGQSLAELRKEYPKIFEQYDIETIKLADILKLKQQINEEDGRRKTEAEKKDFADIETEIAYYEKLLKSLSGQQGVDGYVKKLKDLRAERDILLQEKGKNISEQFISSLKGLDKSVFDRYIGELEKRIKGIGTSGKVKMKLPIDIKGTLSDEAIYDVKDIKTLIDTTKAAKKAKESSTNSEKKAGTEWLSSYKKAYEDADKAYNDFLKSKQVMSEADRDKELKRLKELRDTAKTTYETKGGSTSSDTKQESAAEKLREQQEKLKSLQDKQSKDSIRNVKDLEFEVAQSKITAMQEGSEKTITQMNLNHQKEIETLKRNREDYLQKKIEAERAIFEADPSNKGKSFDSSTVSLNKDEKGMFNNLLESTISQQGDELANYYKEILSKYQGYTEKRLAAQKKFQQERDALVNAGASKETLAEHDYQRDETYKSIDNEFAMREDSFKAWADNIADLSLEKLRELLVQAERELERSEFLNPNDPKLAGQRAKITSLKNTISEKSTETNTSPSKRSQKDWQDLYNTLSKVEREFDEIGKAVGGTAGEIISAAGGIATSTLQMIDGITTLANGSSEAMAGTAQAASKSIQAVEKASVILAIIGAALQIATKIANMFGADYSNYNKAKENYENYVEVLDTVISKQKELMETMTGKAAVEASQKALELIEKQADAARILGKERLNAGASAGSHSIGVRIRKGMSSEGWNEAKKALGSAFYNNGIGDGRMTGLFDLSVEQLEKLQMEAPTFWAKLDGDVREYLEQIIACNEKTEEMKDLLNEALTQVSFDDVYSNFLDALSDMDASSEDFADNFEKYMQKAILNSMLIDNYKSRIDEWYKAFAKANDDNAGITEEEYKDLQNDWNNLISDALSERDKLKDLFGWTSNESTSQSSTTKGFQAMSQDTGNELNGRFTALQISNEEIKNSMLSMLTGVNLISTTTANNGITLTEIRNLAISSNSYLEDIARFTKPLLEVGGKLDRIENNTKGLATR